MRIVVCVKQVPDTAARLEVQEGSLEANAGGIPPVMNPFDEFALEEALRLRETHGGEVVLLTLAREPVEETIFHGLAMGADRGVVLDNSATRSVNTRRTGKLLAAAIAEISPDLILCGDHAVDDEAYEVGAVIAEMLGTPHITGVERINFDPGSGSQARCRRTNAIETYRFPLPAVLSCIRGEQLPRYPTMDGIFDAGMKPVETRNVAGAEALPPSSISRVSLIAPDEARAGEIITGNDGEAVETLIKRIAVRTPVLQ